AASTNEAAGGPAAAAKTGAASEATGSQYTANQGCVAGFKCDSGRAEHAETPALRSQPDRRDRSAADISQSAGARSGRGGRRPAHHRTAGGAGERRARDRTAGRPAVEL